MLSRLVEVGTGSARVLEILSACQIVGWVCVMELTWARRLRCCIPFNAIIEQESFAYGVGVIPDVM